MLSKVVLAHRQVLGVVQGCVGLWSGTWCIVQGCVGSWTGAWCCPRLCWLIGRYLVLSKVVLVCGQVLGVLSKVVLAHGQVLGVVQGCVGS